jgi:hypothetical protein
LSRQFVYEHWDLAINFSKTALPFLSSLSLICELCLMPSARLFITVAEDRFWNRYNTMLRDPNSILKMMDGAYIVEPATIRFELYNVASESNRVAWMYARSRIRFVLDEVAEFKYSRRKNSTGGEKAASTVKLN